MLEKLIAWAQGAKTHANHKAIQGRKSGGQRDTNMVDWRKEGGGTIE